ncbi:MAG: hypothetical protein Q4D64_09600 [Prevotellaceae bacterium]|nr:hypothetical protein [Prevotellaceae bacterium]
MQEKEEIEILKGIITELNISENRISDLQRTLDLWRDTMKTSEFFNRIFMLYKFLMEKSDMERLADYIHIKYGSGLGKKYFETQPQNRGNEQSGENDNAKDLEIARLKAEIERLNKELNKKNMDKEEKIKMLKELAEAKGSLTVILEQNNEHNIGNVENGGVGIQIFHQVQTVNNGKKEPTGNKDGRKKKPSNAKYVRDTFTYRFLGEEDGMKRLTMLYQAMLPEGWIPKETKHEDFTAIFKGKPTDVKVKWTGKQSDLYALINQLEERGLISCSEGATKWVITGSHFLDSNSRPFTGWNKQKVPQKSALAIEAIADLLDPTKDIDKKRLSSLD